MARLKDRLGTPPPAPRSAEEWRTVARARNQAALHLLETWLAADADAEQQESLEYLMAALDADRAEERKLFS